MNITEEEQDSLFRVIAGILHLGNIIFTQSYPSIISLFIPLFIFFFPPSFV
jgi:hypothetical protein